MIVVGVILARVYDQWILCVICDVYSVCKVVYTVCVFAVMHAVLSSLEVHL